MTDERLIEELALQDYLRVQERKRTAQIEKKLQELEVRIKQLEDKPPD